MAHLKISKTRAEQTPAEWLRLGSQLGELVNVWSGRSDIVAYVGPGAGQDAPACFNPPMAEVEVNVSVAFGAAVTPENIGDIRERGTQFDYPRASGAIFHEALHARYSRYDLLKANEELSKNEMQALIILEETRIEAQGVENFPANRVFLRACAMDIILDDIRDHLEENTTTRAMAQMAALVCARVDAGSLDAEDALDVQDLVAEFFGTTRYAQLRDIWLRFQKHEQHYNPTNLYVLAKEWEALISEVSEENGDVEEESSVKAIMSAIISDIIKSLEEAAEDIAIAIGDEAQEQEQKEEWKEVVDLRGKAAKQQKDHEKVSEEVFNKSTGEAGNGSYSRIKETRAPSGVERAAAVKIANMLERAKYRERDEKEVTSILPPGRLRSRAMVQEAAYKARGSMMHAEPWKRTVRKHTDDPTLNVGVMVDISGSMADAMQPMAVTAWAMSEAVRRVQGRCAMVYYGSGVFPTLKPGQHLPEVNVYTAPDGTEKFDRAFKALDGSLNLLNGTGARLLVVVSDGCYIEQERERATHWVRECEKAGVAIVWLPFTREYQLGYVREIVKGTSVALLQDVKDPADAALQIGKAAADALTKIGARNAA
ncbi:MAG: VWA domain-containing protein [Micrococcales bacterium]|nr:VWA domain-containing protein [Micrococcales bacterium]